MDPQISSHEEFKLMSFNIAHGRGLALYQGFSGPRRIFKNLDRIAGLISEQQPDIVALQEIDASSHWNRHINLLDYLQSATGYPHAIHGIHNKRGGARPLAYGNAFLSKFKALCWSVTPFGSKRLGEKGFLEARFQAPRTEIDVINLHLDFRSRKTRLKQVDQLLAFISQHSKDDPYPLPPLICGDFNAGSGSQRDALQKLIKGTADSLDYCYAPKSQRTFPAHLPARGLDFILYARPYGLLKSVAIRSFTSDHLPVIASLSAPANLKKAAAIHGEES